MCIYYKEILAIRVISIPYLNGNHLFEVTIGSKKCIIGATYSSPCQNSDEFETFLLNFKFLTSRYFQSQPLSNTATR